MFTFDPQRNKKTNTHLQSFMSLNSINLETADIALLYKNSLVEIREDQKAPSATTQKTIEAKSRWQFLGDNKKHTLVVVRYPDAIHIPDKQLSFLTKLLAACSLNLGDVAILNFKHYDSPDFNEIINQFKPKTVLLFGVEPGEFGMPMIFPQFQVQGYKDSVYVSSPSLETIEPDKILKGKLWACLKKIFNL